MTNLLPIFKRNAAREQLAWSGCSIFLGHPRDTHPVGRLSAALFIELSQMEMKKHKPELPAEWCCLPTDIFAFSILGPTRPFPIWWFNPSTCSDQCWNFKFKRLLRSYHQDNHKPQVLAGNIAKADNCVRAYLWHWKPRDTVTNDT